MPTDPITLRPYQQRAVDGLRAARRAGRRALLLVAPTGAGKTTMAADIVRGAAAKGSATIFLAHRIELIDQASDRLTLFGLPHGIIKAGRKATPEALLQVVSIQTITRRTLPPATVIIVDEAHRVLGASYLKLLEAYPDATIIGLTATPIRLDGRGLGDVFEHLEEAATIGELVESGDLLRPRVFAPSVPDLTGVRTQAGDFNGLQLAEAMDKPQLVGDVVATWLRLAGGQRTVVFAASVEHSRHLCDGFAAAGVAAEHLDGETDPDERKAILARLEAGTTTVVCNHGVLTEGWDCPPCAVCVLARPTKSLGLYLQMVGRVLRPDPRKTGALVLDHAGATLMHGLVTEERAWSLDPKKKREQAAPSVRQCGACYAIAPGGTPVCPECGEAYAEPARAEATTLRVRDGELREITEDQLAARKEPLKRRGTWAREFPAVRGPEAPVADAAALYTTLKSYGAQRGYKPGWAVWMFSQVAGCAPSKEVRAASRLRQEVAG